MPVLIVEDDPSTLFAYAERLRRAGFEVVETETGQRALDLLEAGLRPGVVLLDLGLPDVSGTELLTYLHGESGLRDIPTVVVTGREPERLGDLAVDALLFKPLPASEPAAIIATLHPRRAPIRGRGRVRTTVHRLADSVVPTLWCPRCGAPLEYRQSVFAGVGPAERWDVFDCQQCGPFEYRHRTRKLRPGDR